MSKDSIILEGLRLRIEVPSPESIVLWETRVNKAELARFVLVLKPHEVRILIKALESAIIKADYDSFKRQSRKSK